MDRGEISKVAGTSTAAKVIGVEDSAGTLETGKYADIIGVQGDPLSDIKLTQNVGLVMKGGKFVHTRGVSKDSI